MAVAILAGLQPEVSGSLVEEAVRLTLERLAA